MEYDLPRIRERIQYIETCLSRLETLRALPEESFQSDFRNIEAAKHLLQTAIEAMMDIASHIAARRRLGTPREGADVFRRLAEVGLLPAERVPVYVRMVRFRNLVVHLYHEVDAGRIYEILHTGLDDFRQFIAEIWAIVHQP
ncbi:MAG: DUF86 domain-containing protein [Chloroflexi bacterium]|jgi:uncharacterized protein YutE (UPF0331/DUF86 family)|nr:DUF86 domain-containing protein [Chloroflexota bacterium]